MQMSYAVKTVSVKQWALFVWMVDNCEKKQNNACKGCGMVEDCVKLYQNVAEICMSNRVESEFEHDNHQPSKGNGCVENHGRDLGKTLRKLGREHRLSEGIGV
jgi:hypothetical protein